MKKRKVIKKMKDFFRRGSNKSRIIVLNQCDKCNIDEVFNKTITFVLELLENDDIDAAKKYLRVLVKNEEDFLEEEEI